MPAKRHTSKPIITEHADNHAQMQLETANTSALFMSIGDGAIATNEHGKIARINEQALAILGYSEKEVLGKWFQKIVVAFDEQGVRIEPMNRPITQAILSGKPVSTKLFYQAKDGHKVPVSVTVAPIILDGTPSGAVEVFRDITREHEVDAMKSEFISLASHQLRTPLTAITTYTHMLLQGFKGPVSPEQQQFLDIILASADRMNELIDTLLTVSRLESGNIEVNPTRVNISELLRRTKQELWPLAKAKRQYLITKDHDRDVWTQTDALLLTEICTNIISNAIKYTPEEGTVVIKLTQAGGRISIEITDNGYGIPESLQNRIFTKFFRAPNILKEEAVGTGLGLYMVKELVERLQGKITFTSIVDEGTTFVISLPKV